MQRAEKRSIGHEGLLGLASLIWGFAFVAQKSGMETMGPMAFNGIRFLLGTLALLPFYLYQRKRSNARPTESKSGKLWRAGIWSGVVLLVAATLQQTGMVFTTTANGGFITALYVIFVPIMGIFSGIPVRKKIWAGAILALSGLYFLTGHEGLTIYKGDALILASAVFFAFHVLLIDDYSRHLPTLPLAMIQFALIGMVSLIISFFTEELTRTSIEQTLIPLVYGGIMSVGVAYTLQIIGQKRANPAHAAIILSMESLFAALGGWWLLGESLTPFQMMGAGIAFSGLLIAQWPGMKSRKRP